jgi:hypothetical protein
LAENQLFPDETGSGTTASSRQPRDFAVLPAIRPATATGIHELGRRQRATIVGTKIYEPHETSWR